MGKIFVIGNPVAGYGHNRRKIDQFVHILAEGGCKTEVLLTSAPGDARRFAGELEPYADTLVVAGGDGTLNEVVNGLLDPSRIPILLLPTGTSNTMAKELALPKKVESIVGTLKRMRIRKVDMGKIDDRRFLLFVGAGLDAMVTEEIHRRQRYGSGYGRYIIPLLKTLFHYRPPDLRVTVDGVAERGEMVVVSNTRNYAWILKLADLARCDSGHMDICVFSVKNIFEFVPYAFAAARSRVSRLRDVCYLTGRDIVLTSNRPVPVQIDGDYFGNTPVHISIVPSAVPMITNLPPKVIHPKDKAYKAPKGIDSPVSLT